MFSVWFCVNHKKNRLNGGEELRFKCIKCGYTADADYKHSSAKKKSEAQVANLPPIYVNTRQIELAILERFDRASLGLHR